MDNQKGMADLIREVRKSPEYEETVALLSKMDDRDLFRLGFALTAWAERKLAKGLKED